MYSLQSVISAYFLFTKQPIGYLIIRAILLCQLRWNILYMDGIADIKIILPSLPGNDLAHK